MNLEKLLSEQGREPLTDKVNGSPLRALVNATFKRIGLPVIDKNTPSEQILEAIYGIEDTGVREMLLSKEVAEVKGVQNYKRVLSITAVVATLITFTFFTWAIKGDASLTPEEVDMVKSIGNGVLDIVKMLVSG